MQIEASALLEISSLFGTALCLSSWLCFLNSFYVDGLLYECFVYSVLATSTNTTMRVLVLDRRVGLKC